MFVYKKNERRKSSLEMDFQLKKNEKFSFFLNGDNVIKKSIWVCNTVNVESKFENISKIVF